MLKSEAELKIPASLRCPLTILPPYVVRASAPHSHDRRSTQRSWFPSTDASYRYMLRREEWGGVPGDAVA